MGARIQPGETPLQATHQQVLALQIGLVYRGYLQFPAGTGLNVLGNFHHAIGVKVKTHYGIVAFRVLRLFLYAETIALFVKLGHAISFGVIDVIAKDAGFSFLRGFHALPEQAREARSVKDVVTQHQANTVVPYKFLANDKRLRQSIGRGLLGILKRDSKVFSVT